MRNIKLSAFLLAGTSIISTAAFGQASVETVVVTGSRVITDIQNSPTPITIVTADQLQATTPTDIPDALNKLPVFVGSSTQRSTNNASSNANGNVLNLRNFGAQRTLVLFDGHRVTPSTAAGTVDIDTLPQLLMSRVDVVTGGASAVYGSDAVTGVVNFVLDKNFRGVKYNASAGISSAGLGATYQAGAAAGFDILGGRGHVEGAARLFNSDPVLNIDLPYGPAVWGATGSGTTPASPIVSTKNIRSVWAPSGLILSCGTGCTAANQQFIAPGVIGAYNQGILTNTNGVVSGGDGGFGTNTNAQAALRSYDAFLRGSYSLDNDTSIYVQGVAAQSTNQNNQYNGYIRSPLPNAFFKSNAFLPPAAQALLNTGTGTTFVLSKGIPEFGLRNRGVSRNLSITVGADGQLAGKYEWDLFFTHGNNRLSETNNGNPNNAKLLAAEDAVFNASGQVVCYATTPAAGAAVNAAYAGCIPVNPFGPGTVNAPSFRWYSNVTNFQMTNELDDVGGSISGDVFDLPAGPIKAALSGESRWMSLGVNSNFSPTAQLDCTGLRLCTTPAPLLWGSNTVQGFAPVTENVWEFAGEIDAPLLKDLPLIQSLSVNLAGRYTDYSVTGTVQTWKIGLDHHITDDIRLRFTTSVDIRAPTLNDLFGPVQQNSSAFNDQHTNTAGGTIVQVSGGNPALVPEIARTYTAGAVFTPTFIPNLTVSVDYYQIRMKNAISTIAGTQGPIQNLCEASAPSYNSPFCSLYIRPLAYSNTTPANYPTKVLSTSLNASFTQISGTDIEVDYSFDLADLMEGLPGHVALRELLGLQPVNESQSFTGAPYTWTAQPKARSSSFLNYSVGNWKINLQDTWTSGWKKSSNSTTIYYAEPRVKSYNILDVNIARTFDFDGSRADVYLSVQNVFGAPGPLVPAGNVAGLGYPVPAGYPVLGRVFNVGIRGNL